MQALMMRLILPESRFQKVWDIILTPYQRSGYIPPDHLTFIAELPLRLKLPLLEDTNLMNTATVDHG